MWKGVNLFQRWRWGFYTVFEIPGFKLDFCFPFTWKDYRFASWDNFQSIFNFQTSPPLLSIAFSRLLCWLFKKAQSVLVWFAYEFYFLVQSLFSNLPDRRKETEKKKEAKKREWQLQKKRRGQPKKVGPSSLTTWSVLGGQGKLLTAFPSCSPHWLLSHFLLRGLFFSAWVCFLFHYFFSPALKWLTLRS